MLTDVLPYLRCPRCHLPLGREADGLRCPSGHTYNVARQGYADLATGPLRHGDTPAMVAARETFLATGGYDFLAAALAAAAGRAATTPDTAGPGTTVPQTGGTHAAAGTHAAGGTRGATLVVDVGGGTGYHLAKVLDALPAAVGLVVDAARPALRRAARAHPRAAAVRADAWGRLPVADGAASVVLDVFAPRHGAELHRVLAPDGLLLVATPAADHLAELYDALGSAPGVRLLRVDPEKPERLAAALARWFRPAGERVHTGRLRLARPHLQALVEMGPSAAHTDPAALARAVAALPAPLPVTASVRLTEWVRC